MLAAFVILVDLIVKPSKLSATSMLSMLVFCGCRYMPLHFWDSR
jgi:hypothetical protein